MASAMKKRRKTRAIASNKRARKERIYKPHIAIIKGALLASVLSVLLSVLLAYLLFRGWFFVSVVPVLTTVIKVVGSCFAAFVAMRGAKVRRCLIAVLSGVAYALLAFVVYSVIGKGFEFSMHLLSDLALGTACALAAWAVLELLVAKKRAR